MDLKKYLTGKDYFIDNYAITMCNEETFKKLNEIVEGDDSWNEDFTIIAQDDILGDFYCVDTEDGKIYNVAHDDSELSFYVSDTIDNFIKLLEITDKNLKDVSNLETKELTEIVDKTISEIKKISNEIDQEDYFAGTFKTMLGLDDDNEDDIDTDEETDTTKENNKSYFSFVWEGKDFDTIDENVMKVAKKLLELKLITVDKSLNKDGQVVTRHPGLCRRKGLVQCIYRNENKNLYDYTYSAKLQHSLKYICGSRDKDDAIVYCTLPSCPINLAGYLYYLENKDK